MRVRKINIQSYYTILNGTKMGQNESGKWRVESGIADEMKVECGEWRVELRMK